MKIDAHQHFWKFDPIRDSWIGDDMRIIQRDFLPCNLQPLLKENDIEGCIAVQASQSEEETHFLLQLANENNFIKGVVGWVDLCADNVAERLAYYKQHLVLKGFRHILQGEKDRAFMLQPSFLKGIEALQQYGFTYDILIFPDQLPFTEKLVRTFPAQKFIIDHLAKPDIKNKDTGKWKDGMQAMAQYPNVYCKLSGMVTEAQWKSWREEDFVPYLDVVVEAFGVDRIVYGSDWPVCLVAASYQQTIHIVKKYFSSFPIEDQNKFFGGNAIIFYNLTD